MNTIDKRAFDALVSVASIRPRLRRDLKFVADEVVAWEERDFIAVTDKARARGVLVVSGLQTRVVPFWLQPRKPNASGRTESIICDICRTWQRGSNSAIITFSNGGSSTVSFLCCDDLLCSLHVRDKTPASALSRAQLRESISVEGRIERLNKNLARILPRV